MKKLTDIVEAFEVTDNYKIKKVKTLNISLKEHGYFRNKEAAKRYAISQIESMIKMHSKWVKRGQKDLDKDIKELNRYLTFKNNIINHKEK